MSRDRSATAEEQKADRERTELGLESERVEMGLEAGVPINKNKVRRDASAGGYPPGAAAGAMLSGEQERFLPRFGCVLWERCVERVPA